VLCSLWTDLIGIKAQFRHGMMFCSCIADRVVGEVYCGECLRETKRMRDWMKK
jgi:hypothetical protein